MHGDFTHLFMNQDKQFSRLLMQQGRVFLDSDFNEAQDILTQALRTLVEVIIGPHGGEPEAFWLTPVAGEEDFAIGQGRYYVNGLLCESMGDLTYQGQFEDEQELPDGALLAYLDVWEQHVTSLEDPDIREVALGGPDTASRARIMWRIRLISPGDVWPEDIESWLEDHVMPISQAQMRARTRPADDEEDPCITSPDSRYRGAENQLYRVEIHSGTVDTNGQPSNERPTIKWSRENGAVVYPVTDGPDVSDNGTVTFRVAHLGRDDGRFGLSPGNWVEYLNDNYTKHGQAGPLLKVQSVDRVTREVTAVSRQSVTFRTGKHALLRRWDHRSDDASGAVPIERGCSPEGWLELEDHIEVCFVSGAEGRYRAGDYWLIPARTATGNIIWPRDENEVSQPTFPRGVRHHYAPLARIVVNDGVSIEEHYRRCVQPLAARDYCPPQNGQ